MARKPRIYFTGALYHVIARGNQGHIIFPKEAEFRLYLEFLEEYKPKMGFLLYAYALRGEFKAVWAYRRFMEEGMIPWVLRSRDYV
jgi:hypothetical protein